MNTIMEDCLILTNNKEYIVFGEDVYINSRLFKKEGEKGR